MARSPPTSICRRFRATTAFELVATSSRSGQGVEQSFTDWRELIRTVEGLEAVAITTPPGPRFDIARECVAAGLHSLLEKPPTAGLAEIADLDCLAQAQQVTLFTTWHAQHHATVRSAAEALAGKRIKSMDIHWHEDVHKWHPGQQWIWEPGGFGCSTPASTHCRSRPRSSRGGCSFKRPSSKCRKMRRRRSPPTSPFRAPQADGPLRASLDWRRTEGEEWTITVEASDGTLVRLEDGGAKLLLNGEERPDQDIGEYPDIYRTFLDLIDERRSLVDIAPFRLVADFLLLAKTTRVDPIVM